MFRRTRTVERPTLVTGAAPWLRCLESRPDAARRLVLLPHAGGASGFFRDWPAALPGDVEVWAVQYPGRERRATEPLPRHLDEVAERATAGILPLLDRPTGVFGHSMGATVGYEVLRRLERGDPAAARQVVHLFVSARQAPHHPRPGLVHTLPDAEFAAVMRRHGGTDAAVFEDAELWELSEPVLRGDYRMAETHRPTPVSPPLDVDVTVLTGDDDPSVEPAAAARWADATTGDFAHHRLPGGHFYLVPRLAEVAATVARRLRESAARGRPVASADDSAR
ncbi:thioesterase II family protein [Streptomyces sp. NPDC048182]|uniref:thioesterase II family protein n=1 Tax=Streptomyces sp. NPDC048182 TaxID=3365507 RepID=UPI00371E3832